MRGIADVQQDLITTLREDADLVDLLPDAQAVMQGHPTGDVGYDVYVAVTPIFEGTDAHRGAMTKSYRIQVSVFASFGWREARDAEASTDALLSMQRILDAVGGVLDTAKGVQEYPEGSVGSPGVREVEDGWLMVSNDWLATGTYLSDDA